MLGDWVDPNQRFEVNTTTAVFVFRYTNTLLNSYQNYVSFVAIHEQRIWEHFFLYDNFEQTLTFQH